MHEVQPEGLPHFYNYMAEVTHFAECILLGREPIASGRTCLADMQVLDAVRESLRLGTRIQVRY